MGIEEIVAIGDRSHHVQRSISSADDRNRAINKGLVILEGSEVALFTKGFQSGNDGL